MAHKAESFYITTKKDKNCIVLYNNVEPKAAEQKQIDRFIGLGYEILFEDKKPGLKVSEMKEALAADAEALAKFEALYYGNEKLYKKDGTEEVAYFAACKFFNEWKKQQKKSKKK
jgi:hypothetical protein